MGKNSSADWAAAVSHLSTIVGPIYHPPVLSIALLPHATLFSTELHCLQLFSVPLPATRLLYYVCIPSCPSVLSFRPSVCVFHLLFCYQGWLPAYTMYIFNEVTLISKSVKMCKL